MKEKLPNWVVATAITLVLGVGGFFIFRAMSGPGDLPAPKIKVRQEVPEHLQGKLTPEMEAQIREQTKKYGEVDPNAPAPEPRKPNGQ